MARVLIAWELGEAWGHLARCLRLAQALQQRGHVVALVLKDIRFPFSWQLPPGIVLLTAPAIRQQRAVKMPSNYAEVLLCCGFNDVADVANRLRAWVSIFSLCEPDVLVQTMHQLRYWPQGLAVFLIWRWEMVLLFRLESFLGPRLGRGSGYLMLGCMVLRLC